MARCQQSDPPWPNATLAPAGQSSLMRGVNLNMRVLSETLAYSDPIMFFCECCTPSCYSPIWMSGAAFDAAICSAPGWQLAEGHKPTPPSEAGELSAAAELRASVRPKLAAAARRQRPHSVRIQLTRHLGARFARSAPRRPVSDSDAALASSAPPALARRPSTTPERLAATTIDNGTLTAGGVPCA
jgi:hypothetical protein